MGDMCANFEQDTLSGLDFIKQLNFGNLYHNDQ